MSARMRDVWIAAGMTAVPFVLLLPLYLYMSSLEVWWGGFVTGSVTLVACFLAAKLSGRWLRWRDALSDQRNDAGDSTS